MLRTRRPGTQALRSLMLFTSNICFFLALTFIPLAEATAINDSRDVAGYSEDSQQRNRATLWRGGSAINLGTLGGSSFATGINNEGVVVGFYVDLLNRQRAFLWIDGQMIDLASTIVPEGFQPLIATGINNNGEIVGQGRNASGRLRGFVLRPTDRPLCFADFNSDGGVDGADVTAFFAAWEAGNLHADVNFDGGVDGNDVSTFHERWEAGSC
jgi:probable HAF family extracellular repeat protein